jgi:hypothetical protein
VLRWRRARFSAAPLSRSEPNRASRALSRVTWGHGRHTTDSHHRRTCRWARQADVLTARHRCPKTSLPVTITAPSARRRGREGTPGKTSVVPSRMTSRGRILGSALTAGQHCPKTSLPVTITAPSAQRHGSGVTPRARTLPSDRRLFAGRAARFDQRLRPGDHEH